MNNMNNMNDVNGRDNAATRPAILQLPQLCLQGALSCFQQACLLVVGGRAPEVEWLRKASEGRIVWAVDHGAKVINLSFTTNTLEWDQSWDEAFLYAFRHDVVVVVAAGNRGSGTTMVGAPATIPGVLTVGGVDQLGLQALLGQRVTHGFDQGEVGVAAGGVECDQLFQPGAGVHSASLGVTCKGPSVGCLRHAGRVHCLSWGWVLGL